MKNILWLIYCSLKLDIRLIFFPLLTLQQKYELLIKKYYVIVKHQIIKFEFGKSKINLWNKEVLYDSQYGLTLLQSILLRHYTQLKPIKNNALLTCIDIGANTGYFTYLLSLVFPRATIHAIEPITQTYQGLKLFTKNDVHIKTHQIAISNQNGTTKMETDKNNSAVSKISSAGSEEVITKTLDTFIIENQIKQIDLLKIDAESHELHILQGAKNALQITKYLLIEITLQNNPNYTLSSLIKMLSTDTYDFQLISVINYPHISEGEVSMLDYLLINTKIPIKRSV